MVAGMVVCAVAVVDLGADHGVAVRPSRRAQEAPVVTRVSIVELDNGGVELVFEGVGWASAFDLSPDEAVTLGRQLVDGAQAWGPTGPAASDVAGNIRAGGGAAERAPEQLSGLLEAFAATLPQHPNCGSAET